MVVFYLLVICLFFEISVLALALPSASFSVQPSQKLVLGRNFTANCSVTVPNPLVDYFVSIDKDGRNLGQWSVFDNRLPIWTRMTVIDHLFVVNSTQKYPVFGIIGRPLGSRAAADRFVRTSGPTVKLCLLSFTVCTTS
ncbi:hypothetical protein TYRP_022103 [Tyrophagus putrescentiae]|nr:hypothetical protein TYRP_022103 [Tyrophagus putrescentiae]